MERAEVKVGARVAVTAEVVQDGRKVYFIEVPGEIAAVGDRDHVEVRTQDGEVVTVKIDGVELR